MSIQRLEIFNRVVQLNNITKAAKELNLSQSGISYAIKALEDELDVQLLTRTRSGVRLTKDGERIYKQSLLVTNSYDNLLQEAAALKGVETGIITVGSFTSVTKNWIPKLITYFKKKFPGITIKVVEDDFLNLENGVLSGELDCSFSIVSDNEQLDYVPLINDRLYCIVSTEHPLAKQNVIKIHEVEKYALIKPKSGFDNELINFFKHYDIQPSIAYEVSDDQSIIALVQANLGINIRPGLVLKNPPRDIKILQLERDPYRTIGLATASNVSHATKRFVTVVTELFQEI